MSVTMNRKPGEEPAVSMTDGPGGQQHERREHPAFAVATVNRVTSGGRGQRLHGSDFAHSGFVRLEIHESVEDRHLHKSWRHPRKHVVSIDMSEVQWGALVSSFGVGGGVPVTMSRRDGAGVPEILGSNDAQKLIKEVRASADDAFAEIRAAFAALEDAVATGKIGAIKAAAHDMRHKVANAGPNVEFSAKQTGEFIEKLVEKAKIEVNAHVMRVQMDHAGLLGHADQPLLSLEDGSKEGI
jgi:hypothetical protein